MLSESMPLHDEEKSRISEEVTVEELEAVVGKREDELNFVHHNRMLGIRGHVLNLRNPDLTEAQRNIEKHGLRHLGTLVVLEHLPDV